MKLGDLVKRRGRDAVRINGIVVEEAYVGPNGERQQVDRVLVMWPDARVQWIPEPWLEKMNEAS